MDRPEIIAHVKKDEIGQWETQTLKDHLEGVAKRAGDFAGEFGNRDWGELIAFWHDLGKFVPDWQKNIRNATGYDPEAHLETLGNRVNHSAAGAILAFKKLEKCPPLARVLAYPIAGHHTGLPDWNPECARGESLPKRLFKDVFNQDLETKDIEQIESEPQSEVFLSKPIAKSAPMNVEKLSRDKTGEQLHLWVRMLFSCLVDADYLDTEAFMDPQKNLERAGYCSLSELKERFDFFMERKGREAQDSPINRKRQGVLALCREKAKLPPGIYTLTVPTGGGKTLSSMAFALEHALSHGKRRVIYAIPYTSIIEQTAKVFKYGTDRDEEIEQSIKRGIPGLFGEENVLEHHCNLDPEKEDARSRLAAENWDAPIVVTTNVQLFESLFSHKTSACRKLHNIANSVIILDEAQLLPPEFLRPILSVLKGLVENFGVTLVLCTATQPALTGKIGSGQAVFEGLENASEIMDTPLGADDAFRRVSFHFPDTKNSEGREWADLAEELTQFEQVLCVVNTRKDCRELHSLMPEGTLHLSALMCGEERSDLINVIKKKLKAGDPLRVISTQLVEAGVDIDFPVVYRAMAGLDSIAQAAGRCNREGVLNRFGKLGRVVVFNPPKLAPPGLLRKGEEACLEVLGSGRVEALDEKVFSEYFRAFYGKANVLDKPRFTDRLVKDAWGERFPEFKFQFRSFAQDFRMIDDQSQHSVVVFYENSSKGRSGSSLIEELRKKGPSRSLFRKLQRFTVSLPQGEFERIRQAGMVEELHGLYVQCCNGLYQNGLGLMTEKDGWCKETLFA
jgi:CRISPR-associated endonuclease/helicase Cas3